eukprot:CAMPEP_0113422182 /NCGR_PEP_ID=MMETSP0013_2-20120614/28322_1 /TAXON_ID=2843 ORGANISM="Skeletonema costatum, Strain 1716" /NCGR_SAMPLE_ID=MMETSP0013_2 /ASSEMBLY_ACC=CAM_ASM_000158 /LENGTH=616 /DNA_ID=CAMNT_0000309905 /DNA_START=95 /DNA_END=1941 /DNA_ORIENTATION=- /assembly_acc=CAM_ASM_000158
MVVLTALLVKAAYDRYNSDNNLSEDSNNNNNSNTLQQQPNNPRNTSRKFRSRRNNKSSTTNSSIDNNRSNSSILPGSPIKFTREHSFHLLHSMSTPSTDCNNDSTTMMAGGNTNNNNSGSSGEGKERYIHHGKYRIDTKREVLTLPPPSSIGGGGKRSEEGEELTEAMLDNDARDGHATRVLESASSSHSGGGGVDGGNGLQQQQQNGGNNTKSGEQTTFRTDVRNEWIDAIFGKDFYPLSNNSSGGHDNGGVDNAESSINIQQGVGAANIPHYVTYGAIVDPMPAINASNSTSTAAPPVSTPRKVVQSKTQSTPIMLQEDGDDPSIVTYRDGGGGTVVSSGVGGNAATTTTAAASTSMTNGGYQTPLRNGGGYPQQTSQHSSSTFQGIPSTPSSTSTNTSSSTTNNKLGITISRIPLGLYIKSISLHSEGYTAGISPGSILVNINGMGMLGERSDRALERLWMYAGLLSGESSGGNELREDGNGTEGGVGNTPPNSTTTSSSSASTPPEDNLQVKRPIQLTLYKSGRLYTVLLLSGHPLSGIEWAPCGNFALVQRVVSNLAGYNAGVRRGTIVCAVNGETLRTLDHVGVARVLRSKFLGGERMVIGLGYTPAASR